MRIVDLAVVGAIENVSNTFIVTHT